MICKDGSLNPNWRVFNHGLAATTLNKTITILDSLNALVEIDDPKRSFQIIRARYIILLLFYTGLRIAKAANHTMGNFIQREKNWFLRVIGKGKKLRVCSL